MPGKAKRPNSIPLTRKESNIASSILVKYFNPNKGESQMRDKSDEIVNEINNVFLENGLEPKYLNIKMTDWVSNRLYRLRKSNLNYKETPVIKKKTPVIKKKTPVIKKKTPVIKKKTLVIKKKTLVIKKKKNYENNNIYKINLKFIDLLPMMEYIENYDSSLNIVKDDYVSIVDNEMFDCLPFIEY